jgi:hypothetical protein
LFRVGVSSVALNISIGANEQNHDRHRHTMTEWSMDQSEDPQELERKIAQASRIVSAVNDQTTVERLTAWAQDLKSRLRQILDARRTRQEISARARELWEQNGRPADRDLEFWLQAEAEIRDRNRE